MQALDTLLGNGLWISLRREQWPSA